MASTPSQRRFAFLALVGCVLFAAFLWLRPLLNIGAGYAAKHACSCHFLQGRALNDIKKHDLNFSILGWASLSAEGEVVRASFLGLAARKAVFRTGIGCTLINDERQVVAPIQSKSGADAGARAGKGSKVSTAYRNTLGPALDFGMQPVAGGGARAIVILQNGDVVGERYAQGYDAETRLLGWSMTKSLTGMAWGAYRTPGPGETDSSSIQKLINRDDLYPVWATDARANIELGELMRMHSGLGWNEAYGSLSDATIMLHEYPDMSAYAAGMPIAEPPGETWRYSSGTTNILVDLLGKEFSNASAYDIFDATFGAVAPSLLVEPDQAGQPVGSSYGWATARDWARLGQFMLQDGVWQGDTLLQPGWIDFMRRPAAGSDGTYGGQLWLPGPDMPSLPDDAFTMRGFQDQRVFVIPSRGVVIARLGHNEDKVADFDELVRLVLGGL